MPVYDPTDHELLSPAAQRLGAPALAAQADAAESVLGRGGTLLADTDFEDGTAEYDRAVLAVVYQVNYQLAAGVDAEVYGSEQRGDRQKSYRGGVLNPFPVVSPRAQAIVNTLIDPSADTSSWPAAGGVR